MQQWGTVRGLPVGVKIERPGSEPSQHGGLLRGPGDRAILTIGERLLVRIELPGELNGSVAIGFNLGLVSDQLENDVVTALAAMFPESAHPTPQQRQSLELMLTLVRRAVRQAIGCTCSPLGAAVHVGDVLCPLHGAENIATSR